MQLPGAAGRTVLTVFLTGVAATSSGQTIEYIYDTQNRLVEARQGEDILVRFQYDFEGRLTRKIGRQGLRDFIYDGRRVLAAYDENGVKVASYTWGLDHLISVDLRGEGTRFYHYDALGSVVTLTIESGAVVARYSWDAWGNLRNPAALSLSQNRMGYTGHRFDEEVGYLHAQSRHFDPLTGRFTTQDTNLGQFEAPASQNRYAYAHDNPTRYVDPTGHEVRAAGTPEDVARLKEEILHEWAGSQEVFDRHFSLEKGRVIVREDGPAPLDPAARLLYDLAKSPEVYQFYYGRDAREASSHIQASAKERKEMEKAYLFKERVTGGGTIIATAGRPRQPDPEAGTFTYVALNPETEITEVAVGVAAGKPEEPAVAAGVGKRVPHYRLFLHEAAENQEFARQSPVASDYPGAHEAAMRHEVIVEGARHEGSGFASGDLGITKSTEKKDEKKK